MKLRLRIDVVRLFANRYTETMIDDVACTCCKGLQAKNGNSDAERPERHHSVDEVVDKHRLGVPRRSTMNCVLTAKAARLMI